MFPSIETRQIVKTFEYDPFVENLATSVYIVNIFTYAKVSNTEERYMRIKNFTVRENDSTKSDGC